MSTEQPVDPQAVEETKRQIRGLVNEIATLTRQDLDPTVFYGEFLQRVITALAAVGGAVWMLRPGAGLELSYQSNLRQAFPEDDGEDQMRHARLLHRVVRNGEQLLVPPYSGAAGDEEAGNPTSYLLVLAPIFDDEKPTGVIEIFQRPTSGPASQRGYLRFLTEMCQHAGDYLRSRRLRELTDWQSLFSQVDRFSRGVHESLDPRTTAYTIANEGRRLIGCDRVSVGLRKGRKCIVQAVSGQDTMDTRANSVVLLSKLATAVMRSGEPLWYTGDASDLPPQIEDAVHDYVDETHTKTVAVLPLFKPSDYVPDGDEAKRLQEEKEEVIGTLIVEQIEDSRAPAEFAHGVELVSEHSSRALANAMDHNNLFLMPLWRTLGRVGWVIQARTLPKTLAVFAAVCLAVAALVLIPYDFDMKGSGKLQPKERREVFVDVNGDVIEVHKDHGDFVEQGEPLLTLQNTELMARREKVLGELVATRARKLSVDRRRRDRDIEPNERASLDQEPHQLYVKIETLEAERKLVEEQIEKLIVRSPLTGQILTFQVSRNFLRRPLNRGDNVIVVADLNGEWVLDVNMEEDNMGHVADAIPSDGSPMDVEYILKSEPKNQLQGKLDPNQIHDAAQLNDDSGQKRNTVRMLVDVDEADLTDPRPGTEVTAKVRCGQRSIGYVWFHDLIEFVQSRWFF